MEGGEGWKIVLVPTRSPRKLSTFDRVGMSICPHVWFHPGTSNGECGKQKGREMKHKESGAAFKVFLVPNCPQTSKMEGVLWADVLLPPQANQ